MATPAATLMSAAACYRCLGMTDFEAMRLVLWDSISQNINPAPPGATNYLLWDVGNNVLIPQVGDKFVWQ